MRGATPKDHELLLKRIAAHLRMTREGPYAWSQRVMGDKTFLWKLKNYQRMPFGSSLKKIERDIKRAQLARAKAQALRSGPRHGY